MKKTFLRLVLGASVLATGALGSASSRASLLYSQISNHDGGFASQNDTTGGNGNYATAYDNFTLGATSSITDVTWAGSYYNPPAQGTITGFTVSFYADNGGIPGALLATTSVSGTASETFVGPDNFANPEYDYAMALGTAFVATAGTQYWMSVVPDVGFPPQWAWETSSQGDGAAYQVFFGTGGSTGSDLAFSLNGSVVPEPSAIVSLGLGALGILGYARRRRVAV